MDAIYSGDPLDDKLMAAFQCMNSNCTSVECSQNQKSIKDIEKGLYDGSLSVVERKILSAIIKHSRLCDTFNCTIPWCSSITTHNFSNIEDLIYFYGKCLAQKFELTNKDSYFYMYDSNLNYDYFVVAEDPIPIVKIRPEVINIIEGNNNYHDEFPSIDNWINIHDQSTLALVPKPDVNYEILNMDINYGFFSVCAFDQRYFQITEQICLDEIQENLEILRTISHVNLHHLYWSCYTPKSRLYFCNSFYSGQKSLSEILKAQPSGQLPISTAVQYIRELLNAALYLLEHNFLYLMWTAESILLVNNSVCLKDLSLLLPCELDEEEISFYTDSFPPYLLAPEVFTNILNAKAVVWGIGTLFYHFLYGHHRFYNFCHLSKIKLYEKLRLLSLPEFMVNHPDVVIENIFCHIFIHYNERVDLKQLTYLLGNFL